MEAALHFRLSPVRYPRLSASNVGYGKEVVLASATARSRVLPRSGNLYHCG